MGKFFDWLDHRTGFRKLRDVMLLEHIPGGAKWRYVWGSALAFVFLIQLVTGVLLMFHYSAGESTAWGSVYFIQYEMDFGWLIRGLHHFGSQTMVVLLGVHMLQVVIAGAHLPPREVNWWLGLGLMAIVLGLSLTGYLLPWDQKGFWATQVATNIAGNLPELGPGVQKTVVGGSEYGHHTLTHFYALHVGVLPPLLIVLLIAHIAVFRRHGLTTPPGAKGEGVFWPDQAFKDMAVSMLVFGVMLALVIFGGQGNKIDLPESVQSERSLYDKIAHAGRDGRGADLDAPADPATESYPARPEWYFLFLFQLLKYFEGDMEIMGTVVIPNVVLLILLILPLLGYGRLRKFGHFVGVMVIVALLCAVGILTYLAMDADAKNTDFQEAEAKAKKQAQRVVQLAWEDKIPEEGAKYLLRRDPLTVGPKLFENNCAVCHVLPIDKDGKTIVVKGPDKAPDLTAFGTKEWNLRFLSHPDSADFLGRTSLPFKKKKEKTPQSNMQRFIEENFPHVTKTDKEIADLPKEEQVLAVKDKADLQSLADWLARHPRKTKETDKDAAFQEGVRLFADRGCTTCHKWEKQGAETGPDLTGYGDAEWIRGMIMAPYHRSRYGLRNTMPAFRELQGRNREPVVRQEFEELVRLVQKENDLPRADVEKAYRFANLSDIDREIIIRYLTRDYHVVSAGDFTPSK